MIDQQVLVKIKFNQISERKAWQGINALYCGVPGTSTLNPYEGILMFQQEKDYIDSNSKIIDVMREIYDLLHTNQNQTAKGSKSPITDENQIQQYSISNSQFIKFKFQELLHSYSKSNQNTSAQFSPSQPQKQSNNFDYSDNIIKKINAISGSQSYFSQNHNYNNNGQNSKLCLYKMLKCESKLVKFIFELNGLIHTDRHDWNVLWTHTQGKTYFYERLNSTQKINHFPSSTEITRKDRMAINIKKMQEKYSKAYFNFIPETFALPDQYNEFEAHFEMLENRIRIMNNGGISLASSTEGSLSNHNSMNGSGKNMKKNLWIVKPSCSSRGRGIFIIENLKQVPRHESIVVSRYIESPLLLYGHKFDLRIYVVITCYDPLRVYVYREGLVRFASEKYDISKFNDATKFSHLTNYSINKKNENYIQNENAEDDDNGFKWSLSAMNEHFESQGIDVNLMWSKIYDVIIKSLISIEDSIKSQMKKSSVNRNNCYELFGYDIILDNNLKQRKSYVYSSYSPWLLEVNLSPSLAFESPLDLKIKGNLLKDTFNLIGVKKPNNEFNKPTLSSNQYNTENNKTNKKQIQPSQMSSTFNPNKTFTKDMNNGQNEVQDSIMNEILQQIKNMQELSWHQKEYLNSFTQLQQKQKDIIIESILELKRRGNFIRIYPNKNTDFYDCFFQNNKQTQQVMYSFLYHEQFIQFKNLKKTNNIFNLKLNNNNKGQMNNGAKSPVKNMNSTMIVQQKNLGQTNSLENSKIKDLIFCTLEYLKRYQQMSQGINKNDLQKLNQQLYQYLSDESIWQNLENISNIKNLEKVTIEQSQSIVSGFGRIFKQRLELLQKIISSESISSSKTGKEKQMQSNSKNRLKVAGNIITQINQKQLENIFIKFKNLSNLQLTETLIKKINIINQQNSPPRESEEDLKSSIKEFDKQLLYYQNEGSSDNINLLDYMQFNGNLTISLDDKYLSKKHTITATLNRNLGINAEFSKKSSIQSKTTQQDNDLQSQMSQDLLQKVKQLNKKLTTFKNQGTINQQQNTKSQLYQVSQMIEQQLESSSQERDQSSIEQNEYAIMGGNNQLSKEKIARDKSSLKVLEEILEEQNNTKQRKSQSNFFKHRYSKDQQSVTINEKEQEYNQVSPPAAYQPFISPFQLFNQTFTNINKNSKVDPQYQPRDSIKYSSQSNRRAIQKQPVSINTMEKSNKIYEIYGPQNSMKARLINQKNLQNPNVYGVSNSTNNSFSLINQKKKRDKSQRNQSYTKDQRELIMMSGGEIQSNSINPMLLPGILNNNK